MRERQGEPFPHQLLIGNILATKGQIDAIGYPALFKPPACLLPPQEYRAW